MLSHYFGRPLAYLGYGGSGKQVRDLLHMDDLLELIEEQLRHPDHWAGTTFNVGGGRAGRQPLAARDHRAVSRAHGPCSASPTSATAARG
jgi:nucleoside-diphosphate-sugar epimerase